MSPQSVGDSTGLIADRDELERGFRRLSAEQRAVLVLHYYLGMSVTAVAETLDVPLGTAQSRLAVPWRPCATRWEPTPNMVSPPCEREGSHERDRPPRARPHGVVR